MWFLVCVYFFFSIFFFKESNVLATCHSAFEVGACQLPANSYSTSFPVALGNIAQLGNLKFAPSLCGHVLSVNCGNGALSIIVTNSNLGGGLDLYRSSWNKATNSKSPGETYCSVELTSQNTFAFDGPVCYHATSETQNQYYRAVGLLNTKNKIVVAARFNGITGVPQSSAPYFQFNGFGLANSPVIFTFSDGSTQSIPLNQCKDGANKQMWQ